MSLMSTSLLPLDASRSVAALPSRTGALTDARRKVIETPLKYSERKQRWIKRGRAWCEQAGLPTNLSVSVILSPKTHPEDRWLEMIEKDLPRTGVHKAFKQADTKARLRRVLHAFCRHVPTTGYCQSLSLIAAELLIHVSLDEDAALNLLVCISEVLLPEYFSDGMRGLVGDLDAFHIVMSDRLPKLYEHLQRLGEADDGPPVVNAFVSAWLSSMFIHLLPAQKLKKLWDCFLEDGSEILFRYILALFSLMEADLLRADSAMQFYSTMAALANLMDTADNPLFPGQIVLKHTYALAPLPMPGLAHLRLTRKTAVSHSISDGGLKYLSYDLISSGNPGFISMTHDNEASDEEWDDLTFAKDLVERREASGAAPEVYVPEGGEADPDAIWELVDTEEATEEDVPFTSDTFVHQETQYHWLVNQTKLAAPDTTPRIRSMCGELDAMLLEKCAARYKRWGMEDADPIEQNRLILEIMRHERQLATKSDPAPQQELQNGLRPTQRLFASIQRRLTPHPPAPSSPTPPPQTAADPPESRHTRSPSNGSQRTSLARAFAAAFSTKT